MGQQKLKVLFVFYSFIGCDQIFLFVSIGKKKVWEVWVIYDEVMEVFQSLSVVLMILVVLDVIFVFQCFMVFMYDCISLCIIVNVVCKDFFICKGRNIELIFLIVDVLLQYIKRVVFQVGYCWGKCLEVLF